MRCVLAVRIHEAFFSEVLVDAQINGLLQVHVDLVIGGRDVVDDLEEDRRLGVRGEVGSLEVRLRAGPRRSFG